jgi:hypothetical protein
MGGGKFVFHCDFILRFEKRERCIGVTLAVYAMGMVGCVSPSRERKVTSYLFRIV